MSFPNVVHGHENETFTDDSTQRVPVGTKMVIEDGRAFRYAKADSTALVIALLNQSAIPEVAKYADQSVTDDHAAGSTVIKTIGATTTDMAVDELVNGYFWSEQPAQIGPAQRIKSNTVITLSANTGTITPYNPLAIALNGSTDSDTISYIRNTWMNVKIHATAEVAEVAGVTVCAVAASTWAWLQVSGPAKIQTSGSPVVGALVQAVGTAAGEVAIASAATDVFVARFMSWVTSDEDGLFFLTIE